MQGVCPRTESVAVLGKAELKDCNSRVLAQMVKIVWTYVLLYKNKSVYQILNCKLLCSYINMPTRKEL